MKLARPTPKLALTSERRVHTLGDTDSDSLFHRSRKIFPFTASFPEPVMKLRSLHIVFLRTDKVGHRMHVAGSILHVGVWSFVSQSCYCTKIKLPSIILAR